jgi:hypothetical protein
MEHTKSLVAIVGDGTLTIPENTMLSQVNSVHVSASYFHKIRCNILVPQFLLAKIQCSLLAESLTLNFIYVFSNKNF